MCVWGCGCVCASTSLLHACIWSAWVEHKTVKYFAIVLCLALLYSKHSIYTLLQVVLIEHPASLPISREIKKTVLMGIFTTNQGIQKGESGLFLTPVLTLWGGGYIACHVWRWVIVPSDLVQSFGAICAHYRYCMIHCTITNMCAWFESTRERHLICLTKLFGGLSYEKIWRYNNSPPYVMARWLPQQIPPLNFLATNTDYLLIILMHKHSVKFHLIYYFHNNSWQDSRQNSWQAMHAYSCKSYHYSWSNIW